MATVLLSLNGTSAGIAGNPNGAGGGIRGTVHGWTPAAVRRHTRWLWTVDERGLEDREGWAVTLTLRDCPPTGDEWVALVALLLQALRDSEPIDLVHWLVEWQRRGVPHLHLAVYGPPAPVCGRSPISDIMSSYVVRGTARPPLPGPAR